MNDDDWVVLKPDLRLRRSLHADGEFTDHAEGYGTYDVHIDAELVDGRYEIRSLTLSPRDGARPIDGALLRRVRLLEVMEGIMHNSKFELADGSEYVPHYEFSLTVEERGGKREFVVTPTLLVPVGRMAERVKILETARLYTIGNAFIQKGLHHSASALGVTSRTTARWVQVAREQGLLDSVTGTEQ